MADRCDLDHVALAADDTAAALRFLTGELGGTVIFGGQAVGFRPMQVWIGSPDGDGMPVELLEPWDTARNDFLARFVAKQGAGPHHLTFKVPDLLDTIARARAIGVHPVKVDLSDPDWKEAFVMPREAHGTVVQLAQTTHRATRAELLATVAARGPDAHPRWWHDPASPSGPPARLRRVVLRTPAPDDAATLFADLLGGEVESHGDARADLVWPCGSRLRVEARPGPAGIDRLEVEGLDEPRTVLGTRFVPV
jgi:methylmalonyl-CoA/ethylmalonyl-CoA epimerase